MPLSESEYGSGPRHRTGGQGYTSPHRHTNPAGRALRMAPGSGGSKSANNTEKEPGPGYIHSPGMSRRAAQTARANLASPPSLSPRGPQRGGGGAPPGGGEAPPGGGRGQREEESTRKRKRKGGGEQGNKRKKTRKEEGEAGRYRPGRCTLKLDRISWWGVEVKTERGEGARASGDKWNRQPCTITSDLHMYNLYIYIVYSAAS